MVVKNKLESSDLAFEQFSRQNEYKQNKLLFKILLFFLVCISFLLIGKLSNAFPSLSVKMIVISVVIFFTGYFTSYIIFKLKPYSKIIKYCLFVTLELSVVYLLFNPGLMMFILYMLVPVFSCIYMNKRFTLRVTLFCYVAMIINIILRAKYVSPIYSGNNTSVDWALTYGISLSVEYAIMSIVLYFICKRNQKVIYDDYSQVVKEFNSQQNVTSSYVAMLSKKNIAIEGHLTRTSQYVHAICNYLQTQKKYNEILTDDVVFKYTIAALLHDIGIMSIPDKILNKKKVLTLEEKEILKKHPVYGFELVKKNMSFMDKEYLQIVCDMVLFHHEYWDGSGYPYGIKGDFIPLSARILCAANILDNLLSDTPLKKGVSLNEAVEEIKKMQGKELEPEIASAVINCVFSK